MEYATEVTLEEAFHGATRRIGLQVEEACATCGGSGQIAGAVCHVCQGAGAVLQPKRLEVKIPAGVRNGSRVRIAGEGRPGVGGGPRGDLYVVVRVRPHSKFERKGDDLYGSVGVDMYTALLGGKAPVQTLGGTLMLTIKPGTQNGQTFRLRGKGMPVLRRKGEHGDLYVEVDVQLPDQLTDRQRELLEEMRKAGT